MLVVRKSGCDRLQAAPNASPFDRIRSFFKHFGRVGFGRARASQPGRDRAETVGLAVEASYWQLHQRAMQNAADLAAIAAGMEGGTNYQAVARAVAAQYGFVEVVGNVAVDRHPTPRPPRVARQTAIRSPYPTRCHCSFRLVVGYRGDDNRKQQSDGEAVQAGAVATQSGARFYLSARSPSRRERQGPGHNEQRRSQSRHARL